jgi:ribosome-associated translation inhibitor RaiA
MNVSVEAQNVDLSPDWKLQIEDRLGELSDDRDPVVSARTTFVMHQNEIPPAHVTLVVGMRGKNLVAHKSGATMDIALKSTLDTMKREIRKFYEVRADHHKGEVREYDEEPTANPEDSDLGVLAD